jgi:hypothetical protein
LPIDGRLLITDHLRHESAQVRCTEAACGQRQELAASRPLVFDRKAVAPGARSLRKGGFLEQDHVASIVGSVQAPGWLITMPDWVVKNHRNG